MVMVGGWGVLYGRVQVSHVHNLEVELYVPTYRGHERAGVEFLIRSLLWASRCAGDCTLLLLDSPEISS